MISLVFHMRMSNFLGDYGAGQTIKAMHLLPGEDTTITMRTFTHNEEHKEQSKNVLDSFSESSADDLQNTLEKMRSKTSGSTTEENLSETDQWNAGLKISLDIFGGNVGKEGSEIYTTSVNESLSEQISDLEKAVTHHVSSSNSERQITINSETRTSTITETEETIVRHIQNINKSRVLNFVFRQLLQEYVSITYLEDVSIMFTNGFPESKKVVRLSAMDSLLKEVLVSEEAVLEVQNQIYRTLCNLRDYEDETHSIIEKITESNSNCINLTDPTEIKSYVRKKKGITQAAEGFTVPGIIMNVKKRTLRTDSVVVDALLGQGEALDCYSQHIQSELVKTAELENKSLELINQEKEQQITIDSEKWTQEQEKIEQALAVINGITDPIEKAKLYKKVFTDCCDVPQSGGCGCGCHDLESNPE